VGLIGTER